MVTIRRLSEAETEEFLSFMDGPAFSSQPQWQGCYCQEYLNTKAENEAATPASNREQACERIRSGVMQGFLAFEDQDGEEVAIGWMAANSHNIFRLLPPGDSSTATIICFAVDASKQSQGVATALLEFALKDLPEQGYKLVQAAPLANGQFETWGYRGPLALYRKFGFAEGPMLDEQHILVTRTL
jgi:GNAT superfamily N-acetyltransferase